MAPTINIKNMTLAIPDATSEIPPKPKIPAIIAITIQAINTFSIIFKFQNQNNKLWVRNEFNKFLMGDPCNLSSCPRRNNFKFVVDIIISL